MLTFSCQAPHNPRHPSTKQERHCYEAYNEYHRCAKAKGETNPEYVSVFPPLDSHEYFSPQCDTTSCSDASLSRRPIHLCAQLCGCVPPVKYKRPTYFAALFHHNFYFCFASHRRIFTSSLNMLIIFDVLFSNFFYFFSSSFTTPNMFFLMFLYNGLHV